MLAAKNQTKNLQHVLNTITDINIRNANGETFLFNGVSMPGEIASFDILIKLFKQNSGDINAQNKQGVN